MYRPVKAEYLPVPRDGRSFKVLQASCALPILFPPITINGTAYMDGGIVNSIPVQPALDAGCDKIIVVLTQPRGYQKKDSRRMHVIAKKYAAHPSFAEALRNRARTYNQDLARIEKLEKRDAFLSWPPPIHWELNEPKTILRFYRICITWALAHLTPNLALCAII